jgi:hypothetical protein
MAIRGSKGFGIDVCPHCYSSELNDMIGEAGGNGRKCTNCGRRWAVSTLEHGETLTVFEPEKRCGE